ncbi:MAG: hypothetical protein Q7J86_02835 [Bacteroidota bacterium]|nr:hypothetical protein [Bacteroidota bacterium]MDO9613443.1 hypothetical protein [Bacteroidota bacterium]
MKFQLEILAEIETEIEEDEVIEELKSSPSQMVIYWLPEYSHPIFHQFGKRAKSGFG